MKLFSPAMMARARRATAREEYFEYQSMTKEEKEEYRRQQEDFKKRFKILRYVGLTTLLTLCTFYVVLNMTYFSTENIVNLSILGASTLFSLVMTLIKFLKYHKEKYNV